MGQGAVAQSKKQHLSRDRCGVMQTLLSSDTPSSLSQCLSPLDQSAQISAPNTLECLVKLTNLCGKYNCLAGSFLSASVNALK